MSATLIQIQRVLVSIRSRCVHWQILQLPAKCAYLNNSGVSSSLSDTTNRATGLECLVPATSLATQKAAPTGQEYSEIITYSLGAHRIPFVRHCGTANLVGFEWFLHFLRHCEMADVCEDALALCVFRVSGCNKRYKSKSGTRRYIAYCRAE